VIVAALPVSRIRILRPLRIRDFALLWTGMTVSLLGDGLYTVAIAWQVYSISNAPTALAVVGIAWTVPQVLLLLLSGVVSDRFERRLVLMLSDAVRGAAIAAMGVLSVTGNLQLWHAIVLVMAYSVGGAVFAPAFTGIVRDVVPRELLLEANSLDQFVRPLCVRLIGPVLGGVIIGLAGAGTALLTDAATFAFSATAFLLMRTRSLPVAGGRSVRRDVLDGIAYVRSRTWLWATLGATTIALLFFLGPVYVLMPYVVKNSLHGGAQGLGLVFAAGGAGAVVAALFRGQLGLPRRPLAVVYVAWAATAFALVGYALANAVWQAMVVSFVSLACMTTGGIVWTTLLQQSVPARMIGRVSSLDWILSLALAPVSYALIAPIANAFGARATLLGAGIVGGAVMLLVFVGVPGARSVEAREEQADAAAAAA
jgi:DHA3 family tetracycline resistance protein-like MFS transporter